MLFHIQILPFQNHIKIHIKWLAWIKWQMNREFFILIIKCSFNSKSWRSQAVKWYSYKNFHFNRLFTWPICMCRSFFNANSLIFQLEDIVQPFFFSCRRIAVFNRKLIHHIRIGINLNPFKMMRIVKRHFLFFVSRLSLHTQQIIMPKKEEQKDRTWKKKASEMAYPMWECNICR